MLGDKRDLRLRATQDHPSISTTKALTSHDTVRVNKTARHFNCRLIITTPAPLKTKLRYDWYGVATISRLLKNIGLVAECRSLL